MPTAMCNYKLKYLKNVHFISSLKNFINKKKYKYEYINNKHKKHNKFLDKQKKKIKQAKLFEKKFKIKEKYIDIYFEIFLAGASDRN